MKAGSFPVTESISGARKLLEDNPFQPHPLLWNGHLQTIVAAQQRRRICTEEAVEKADVKLRDGTVVESRCLVRDPCRPTLIAIHGMAGSSQSEYMRALSHKASLEGWNWLLFDLYDIRPDVRRRTIFHSGSSPKVRELVAGFVEERKLERIFFVGVSMGGNIVLRLLGEWGDTPPEILLGACVISPLIDLSESWKMLDLRWSNFLYRHYYLSRLKRLALERFQGHRKRIDLQRLESLKTIRDFDEVVTVPVAGFEDVDHYYRQASSMCFLPEIQVPTLLIHSKDDPFLPWKPLTSPDISENPSLLVCLTRKGGHVGFIERKLNDIDRSWAENRAIDFLRYRAHRSMSS